VKETRSQLEDLVGGLQEALGDDLIGVYVHGSLALGCFNPALSDLDVLVVSIRSLAPRQRDAVGPILALGGRIEIHFLAAPSLYPWRHPTPYDLHVGWKGDALGPGEDADLAAHVTVVRHAGIALLGPPATDVFPEVPWTDYEDSLRRDLDWCRDHGSELYAVLSPARIWATLTEGAVHSKASGAAWALERTSEFRPLLERAVDAYRHGDTQPVFGREEVLRFVEFVTGQIRPNQ
jgi:predicted nucleotidyltransferase